MKFPLHGLARSLAGAALSLASPWAACQQAAAAPMALSAALRHDTDGAGLPAGTIALLAVLGCGLVASLLFAWSRSRAGSRRGGLADWRQLLQKPAAASPIAVLGTVRLDLRASLHAVEWEGQRLLIASGEHGVALMAERPAGEVRP